MQVALAGGTPVEFVEEKEIKVSAKGAGGFVGALRNGFDDAVPRRQPNDDQAVFPELVKLQYRAGVVVQIVLFAFCQGLSAGGNDESGFLHRIDIRLQHGGIVIDRRG